MKKNQTRIQIYHNIIDAQGDSLFFCCSEMNFFSPIGSVADGIYP